LTHSSSPSAAGGGVGFLGLLAILFIGLKFTGYIQWSWWLVLLPLYPAAAALSIAAVCLVLVLVLTLGAKALAR
jgi:hypothetical protein